MRAIHMKIDVAAKASQNNGIVTNNFNKAVKLAIKSGLFA